MGLRPSRRQIRAVWTPSPLRRLMRHRITQAALIAAVAVLAVVMLWTKSAALDRAQAAWSDQRSVWVVTQDVAAGDPLVDSVRRTDFPRALVPADALAGTEPLDAQARARVRLYADEIVLEERVSSAAGDLAPPGTAVVTLPVTTQVPLLKTGDLVDVWMVDSANFSSRRVAESVLVLSFSERDVTVAVPASAAAEATVATLRPVTITLVG